MSDGLCVYHLALIGLMGNCQRGEKQGGILVVVGWPTGAVLPDVQKQAWIEFGPRREYDQVKIDMHPDEARSLRDRGWIEECGGQYAATYYRMTEKAWALYTKVENAIREYLQ